MRKKKKNDIKNTPQSYFVTIVDGRRHLEDSANLELRGKSRQQRSRFKLETGDV